MPRVFKVRDRDVGAGATTLYPVDVRTVRHVRTSRDALQSSIFDALKPNVPKPIPHQ